MTHGLAASQIHPAFRNPTYSRFSQLGALKETTRSRLPRAYDAPSSNLLKRYLINPVGRKLLFRGQHKIISEFAEDCHKVFDEYTLTDHDHALFLTVNELDFLGLLNYLAHNPVTVQVKWHVVFHFGLFSGRPAVFDAQRQLLRHLGRAMNSAMARIPYHRISLLTSTEELVEQYEQLNIGRFRMLPYPIDQQTQIEPLEHERSDSNVKITLAGGLRREKGKQEINQVALQLDSLRQKGHNIQLRVQKRKRKWYQRDELSIDLPEKRCRDLIEVRPHPLPADQYRSLINESDIGLLLYDGRSYYARRAGVLCEYLNAGRPVVVPSGCWLSHQIAEPTFQHVVRVVREQANSAPMTLDTLEHPVDNVPLAGGVIAFDQDQHTFELQGECQPAAAMGVQFKWHWPRTHGSYAKLEFIWKDQRNSELSRESQIVGHDSTNEAGALFPVPDHASYFELRLSNAYGNSSMTVQDLRVTPVGIPGDQVARGAVGFSFADYQNVALAVEEILDNLDHYRTTARSFSRQWSKQHDPVSTIAFLTDEPSGLRRAA